MTTGRSAMAALEGSEENDVMSSVGMWEDPAAAMMEENRAQHLEYLNLEDKFSHMHMDSGAQAAVNKEFLARFVMLLLQGDLKLVRGEKFLGKLWGKRGV